MHLPRSGQPQAVLVDRVDVLAARGRRPTPRRPRATRGWPRTATRPRRSRRCRPSRAPPRGSRSSRPPVSPDGRRISISAISAPSMTSRDPSGRSSVKPTPIPSSALPSSESRPLTASAPTTAPQRLVIAADDEHRQRQERQLEVDLLGRDRAEHVHEQAAGEAAERAGERERPEPLPVDADPDRLRRGGILTRRPRLPAERAALVGEGDARRRRSAPTVACSAPVVSGTSESVVAPGPIFVHSRSRLWVISSTANVAIPAASPDSRISGRPTRNAKTPPTAAASTSDATLPIVWSRRSGKRSGRIAGLRLERHGHHAGGEGAERDEADLPEREHARVADEDVDRDDDRDGDERVQEVDLVRARDERRRRSRRRRSAASAPRGRPRCRAAAHTRSTTAARPRANRPAGPQRAGRGSRARRPPRAGRRSCRSAARR